MAKKGTFNSPFFGNFATRLHGTPVRFGILLGQRVEASLGDVVLAAVTPQVPKEDGEAPPIKDVATLLKSQQGDSSFANWAAQHIDSLSKLVPGGIVPLGCFVVASEATVKDLAPQLVPPMRNLIDPLVLSIDPSSRKTSWLQLNTGPKPALRQAQMKPEAYKEHLLLWTTTEVDVMSPFDGSLPHDGADTAELVEQTSRFVDEDLRKRCCCVLSSSQVVDFASEAHVSAIAAKGAEDLRIGFLRSGTVRSGGSEIGCRVRATIAASVLILRRNVEFRHAVEQLRKEVAKTATERVQVALDDCPGELGGKRLDLPWRSFHMPQDLELPLWFGDYCMKDEERAEGRERLGFFLGAQPDMLEQAPDHLDEQKILTAKHPGTYGPEPADVKPKHASNPTEDMQDPGPPKGPIAACVGIAVLIVAVAIPLLR